MNPYCNRCGIPHSTIEACRRDSIRVTVDDGRATRMFVPHGDSVKYVRDSTVEHRPGLPGQRWPTKTITTHTLSWVTVNYE